MTTSIRLIQGPLHVGAALLLATAPVATPPLAAQAIPAGTTDSVSGWAHLLTGPWGCSGAFASGRPLAADIVFAAALNAHWLEYHHRDRAPGRYEATALLGPALADSTVVPTVLYDNFGGHRRFGVTTSPTGEVILARDTTEKGARVERFTFRPRADGTLWFGWEVQRDGGWALGDSLSCRRGG